MGVVLMIVSMAVIMVMMMVMAVLMIVVVRMIMPMRVVARVVRMTRILAEHQRLDRDRHRVRWQTDAAEVDVIEVPQRHAVDHQDLVLELELLAQNRTERLRDVAVEHQVERLAAGNGPRQALRDAACERGDARVRGRAGPSKRQS